MATDIVEYEKQHPEIGQVKSILRRWYQWFHVRFEPKQTHDIYRDDPFSLEPCFAFTSRYTGKRYGSELEDVTKCLFYLPYPKRIVLMHYGRLASVENGEAEFDKYRNKANMDDRRWIDLLKELQVLLDSKNMITHRIKKRHGNTWHQHQ